MQRDQNDCPNVSKRGNAALRHAQSEVGNIYDYLLPTYKKPCIALH